MVSTKNVGRVGVGVAVVVGVFGSLVVGTPVAATALGSDTVACDPEAPGGTSADRVVAEQLNSTLTETMRGGLDAYRVSCARVIVRAVRDRGLNDHAAAIAIATVIVESSLRNLTHGDEQGPSSRGLYQQMPDWGSEVQRLDPAHATGAFLRAMRDDFPGDSWQTTPVGQVCQRVQEPDPDVTNLYQAQAEDAARIVSALWSTGRA